MPAPVVIDMGMAEPPEALVASMVEACQKAVGDGECHLVREAPRGPYRAIAILTWEGPDKVRIEVGLRRDEGTAWRTRALTFQPEDVEVERFRSVGFVVGTLAVEEEQRAEPPAAVTVPPPTSAPGPEVAAPPPAPAPAPAARPGRRASSVGLAGTMGGALDQGALRYGAAVRGRYGLASWIGVAASLGGSLRPTDDDGLSLRFLDAGLGVGFVLLEPAPLGLELTLEGVVENFRAEADASGESDAQQRTLPVARLELGGIWAVAEPIEVFVGGNVVARPASTTVAVAGESVGSTGTLELGVAAGARFAL
jgi:hypothetical protein